MLTAIVSDLHLGTNSVGDIARGADVYERWPLGGVELCNHTIDDTVERPIGHPEPESA